MKKLLALVLTLVLGITAVACQNPAPVQKQSKVVEAIKEVAESDSVKALLQGKNISEYAKEHKQDSDKEVFDENCKKYNINVTYDEVLNNPDKMYEFMGKVLVGELKEQIKNGELTQESVNQLGLLALFGIKVPEIKIVENPTDEEIEDIALAFIELINRVLDPQVLKALGIDINDPESIKQMTEGMLGK